MIARQRRRRSATPARANYLEHTARRQQAGVVYLTPPELARRWRVSPEKILALVARGELAAFNIALRLGGRPRWRIRLADVERFETARAAVPTPKAPRRQKAPADFVEYY